MAVRTIRPVRLQDAQGLTADVYAQIKTDFGALVEPFTLHSQLPELLAGAWIACRESLISGRVERVTKEAVAATVSRINRCPYCVDAHTMMLSGASAKETSEAISLEEDDRIRDPSMRTIVAWAAATRSPGVETLSSPPFSREEGPEIIGTAVFFHYVNRMVSVLLGETPLPSNHRTLKKVFKPIAARFFSRALRRPKSPGASLGLLPAAELPADLTWAEGAPHVEGAFARFASVVERVGKSAVPEEVRAVVLKEVRAWEGETPALGRQWLEDAVQGLREPARSAGRLTLLAALAPYQVDDGVVDDFVRHFPGDERLVATLAWSSFAAARRIGTWLYVP